MPAIAALALLGCDLLRLEPGAELAIELLDPLDVTVSQSVAPVPVTFEVIGCDAFEVSVARRTTAGAGERVLEPVAEGGGVYRADVPMDFIVAESGCGGDAASPRDVHLRLSLRCLDDERRAESRDARISVVTAEHIGRAVWGPYTALLADPAESSVVYGLGERLVRHHVWGDDGDAALAYERERTPLIARDGDVMRLWIGCPVPGCPLTAWPIEGGQSLTESTYVYTYDVVGGAFDYRGDPLVVPGTATGMVARDGAVQVLSQTRGGSYISHFDTEGVRRVETFDGLAPTSGLTRRVDGAVAFVALDEDSPRAWSVVDGDPRAIDLPAPLVDGALHLAPDGVRWLLVDRDLLWLGGDGEPWRPLAHELRGVRHVTWTDAAVVLGDAGAVEVHRPNGQDAERMVRHVVGQDGAPRDVAKVLRAVHAAPDGLLALEYDDGVRFLSAAGEVLGGADPLPCGGLVDGFTLAGDRAALASGDRLLWFDLSRYREDGSP